ncbi:hypothetical protein ACTA71_009108 [Dictyostelium dimigraforme]
MNYFQDWYNFIYSKGYDENDSNLPLPAFNVQFHQHQTTFVKPAYQLRLLYIKAKYKNNSTSALPSTSNDNIKMNFSIGPFKYFKISEGVILLAICLLNPNI